MHVVGRTHSGAENTANSMNIYNSVCVHVRMCQLLVTVCRNRSTSQILPPKALPHVFLFFPRYLLASTLSCCATVHLTPLPISRNEHNHHPFHYTQACRMGRDSASADTTPSHCSARTDTTPSHCSARTDTTPSHCSARTDTTPSHCSDLLVQTPHPLTAVTC